MSRRIIVSGIAAFFSFFFAYSFVFIDYSTLETMQSLKEWSNARGVHEDIFVFYRILNSVTALGWGVAALAAWFCKREIFKMVSVFTLGYFFWDVLTYMPMAKIAGEGVAVEQWVFMVVSTLYVWLALSSFPKVSGERKVVDV